MSAVNEIPLFIEAGNSAWKAARYHTQRQQLEPCGRGGSLQELQAWLQQQAEQQVVLATVGAEQDAQICIAQLQADGYQVLRAETGQFKGFVHCYKEPQYLGVDRWLTLLALLERHMPVVVIDAGTAITVDVMNASGEHLGGWIAPGFHLMQDALVRKSTRLRVNEALPAGLLGRNTADAIGLGCVAALQGVVEQAIKIAEDLLGGQAFELYLTGGDAALLETNTLPEHEVKPLLVLEGLHTWWQEQL